MRGFKGAPGTEAMSREWTDDICLKVVNMKPPGDLNNMRKKILITGASRGIGAATAMLLADNGYDLFLTCSKSMTDLLGVKEEIEKRASSKGYTVSVETCQCDVKDQEAVKAMCKDIIVKGGVYGIINNAAVSYVGLMTDMSYSEWNDVIDTNLNSMFYVTHELVPSMVNKKEGRIINVSSVWGNVGASMEVAYSTAKGGVNAFTKALAKELAPSNVQVNAVAFGCIDTAMNKCFSEDDMEALRQEIPADRIGTPGEAAEMILSVLEGPEYLTGQIITMDGGWI